jgi:GWxTD domain-containing protein
MVVVGVAPAAAQEVSLEQYTELRPRDLPDRYRAWISEEVVWIITAPEREIFLRLDSDEKRERFIETFWLRRDPTPGTPQNEYLPIHYERLAYANYQFGRAAPGPGWRTDMGRMHILLGEPETRNQFHNDSAVYPVEVWFYQMDPRLGVPTFFYLVFWREQGMGEFELYSPAADGPESLLNPSGRDMVRRSGGIGQQGFGLGGLVEGGPETYDALRLIHPDLAAAAFSLIPGEALLGSPLRSDIVISDILEIPDRMVPTIEWAYPILTGAAETEVRFDTLGIESRAIGWLDPAGRPFVSYAARPPGAGVNVGEHEGSSYMTFEVASYLLDSSQRVLEGPPPRLIQTQLGEDQVDRVRKGSMLYVSRIPAVTGELQLELMIENNVSREYGEVGASVRVPAPNPLVVTLGQAILCVGGRPMGQAYDPFVAQLPFQIGQLAMTPTIDGPFVVGGQLYVFHQVLLPSTQNDPVRVNYTLSDADGATVASKQVEVRPSQTDRFGVVNQLTALALDVPPGSYSLRVDLEGSDAREVLPVEVRTRVERAIVHAAALPPATDAGALVRRAAVMRAAGDLESALVVISDALRRDPERYDAEQMHYDLLRDLGRQEELEILLEARIVDAPHDIDLLLQLAEAKARQAKHYDAIRFYERAVLERSASPELLNALAAEYLADTDDLVDNLERAIELLTRSLEIDSEQAGPRATLERALAQTGQNDES